MSKINVNLFDEILSLDDADFALKFMAAIVAKPSDTIEISTPQFERTDGIVPSLPDAWERLRTLSVATLAKIGCGKWDAPDADGRVLMLFPKEWYSHIPDGFMVEDINGEIESFKAGETDYDYRFGCLAYGIRVPTCAHMTTPQLEQEQDMSAASREYFEDWQRELDRDPGYLDWLVVTTSKDAKEQKHEHDSKSENRGLQAGSGRDLPGHLLRGD